MAEENKILIEVEIDQEAAKKQAGELVKRLSTLKDELKKARKEFKDSGGESQEAAEKIAILSQEIKDTSANLRRAQKEAKAETNSLKALRAETNRLNEQRNNLNTSTKEGIAEFNRLTQKLKENREQINQLSKDAGSFKDNIGNYTDSIVQAFQGTTAFSDSLNGVGIGFDIARKGAIGFRTALLAIPLAAVIAAVSTFLNRTREGRELLERFGAVAQATFGVLLDALADIGKGIVDFFSDPIKNSKKALEGLTDFVLSLPELYLNAWKTIGDAALQVGKIIGNALVGNLDASKEAFEGLKTIISETLDNTGISDFAGKLIDAGKAADKLAQQNINARASIRALKVEIGEATRQAEEFRKQRDDETKSEKERLELNRQVLEQEERRRDLQLRSLSLQELILKNEIELAGGRKNIQESQLEQEAEFARERQDILEDFAGRTTEQLTEQNNIQRDALRQRAEAQRLALEERLITETIFAQEELNIRLSIIAKQREAELIGINETSEAAKAIRQKFRNEELKLRKEFADKIKQQQLDIDADIALAENAKTDAFIMRIGKEIEAVAEGNRLKLESDKSYYDSSTQLIKAFQSVTADATKVAISLFGEQSKAARLALAVQKAVAIADIIVKTQQAVALNTTLYPFPVNVAINAATIAASVASIAKVASTEIPTALGFANGGYTGNGGKYEPAGIVHKGEFVVPKQDVQRLGGAGAVSRMTGTPIRGYATGGLVTANSASRSIETTQALSRDFRQIQLQVAVTDINKAQSDYSQIQSLVNQ